MGTSSGTQTTQQNSSTQPWQPAIPALQSILGNVQGLQGQSGINPTESAAIQQLTQNAGGIPNFGPTVANAATNFLGGDPFNKINPAYSAIGANLSNLANPNNLNPFNTPGFSGALNTLNTDITNQIQGEFAGAGRTGSGQDTQTLARGLGQGEASLLANQYNQNVQDLMNANAALYGAGITANNTMSNNVGSGAALAGGVPQLSTQGPGTLLNAGQTPFNLLTGNQGILAGLTVPIAGLGGQSQGYSQTNSSLTPSALQDIVGGAGAFGSLFGGANPAFGNFLGYAGPAFRGLGNLFGGAGGA